jgi:ectoine hydroxylase-related dioxygenase (phytanoyl-CoA dioxygenase family)
MNETTISSVVEAGSAFRLSPQQVTFFRTFGFLKLPGLFKADIERLKEGFDEAFATRTPDKIIRNDALQETDNPVFKDRKRVILFNLVEQSDKLRWVASDPRVLNIVTTLVGQRYEARPTDGHVFDCDTSWHPDMGSDNRFRLKLSFYLDPQRHNSGAIRVIPGSQFDTSDFAQGLLANAYGSPQMLKDSYGVDASEIPCWTIESDPGDLICWNFKIFHATFHGFEQRRLFSMTFAEAKPA